MMFMRLAIEQAHKAYAEGEVPVGAVVELNGHVIGAGYNQNRTLHDPTAHAEIMALRDAAQHIGNHRLLKANLYVTLEPCVMCAGAILHARIKRLIFGATDERWGAAGSVANVLNSPLLNHQCEIIAGIEKCESSELMQQFFADKRSEHS